MFLPVSVSLNEKNPETPNVGWIDLDYCEILINHGVLILSLMFIYNLVYYWYIGSIKV
jgi:hypothetical protein